MASNDELDDLFYACRYGELDEIKLFEGQFGDEPIAAARDDNGNTVLHMCCANGHLDCLNWLLQHVPKSLLAVANNAGSTPLHWAAVNKQLEVLDALIFAGGPGLIEIKNKGGITPLGEAEMAGWEEGSNLLVKLMNIDDKEVKEVVGDDANGAEEA